MSQRHDPPPFSLSHGPWTSLPGRAVGERAVLRRLPGGELTGWQLELAPGGKVACPGLACECLLVALVGRLVCAVVGNQLELSAGHFALIPPNLPFTLRAAGTEPARLAGTCSHPLGEEVLFETC